MEERTNEYQKIKEGQVQVVQKKEEKKKKKKTILVSSTTPKP